MAEFEFWRCWNAIGETSGQFSSQSLCVCSVSIHANYSVQRVSDYHSDGYEVSLEISDITSVAVTSGVAKIVSFPNHGVFIKLDFNKT